MGALTIAKEVLLSGTISGKLGVCEKLGKSWNAHQVCGAIPDDLPIIPSRPSRPELVSPIKVPRRRLGSEKGRIALLHSVAHIEFNAIDLAVDMICRFACAISLDEQTRQAFIDDWISVALDEARHFSLVEARLNELGSAYGDLPAHNGLWEAAMKTSDDVAMRLAIAPMVLEARGLDVTPTLISKLENVGDQDSADILKQIYREEVRHVTIGVKWFKFVAQSRNLQPEKLFQSIISKYFSGIVKPPFNDEARLKAGMNPEFYSLYAA